MGLKTRWMLVGVFTLLALSLVAVFSVQGATSAQITTSQKLYSVGQTMVVSGTGFTPNAYIYLTVVRPDKLTDSVLPQPFTNDSGVFTASYTPPLIPGHYTITATDGSNTAVTAVTGADAIGYNKGVYNKSATTPEDTTGNWTTGNAGSHYLENQWAFYQYEITGIGSTVPSFDVTYNHFQANTKAIFVDALADFHACVDCTDSSHTSGPSQGMLVDTVPLAPSDTTNWVVAASAISHFNRPLNSATDGTGITVLTGSTGFCSSDNPEPPPDLVTTFPAETHCFHVDGPTLGALFGNTLSSGTHTITIFYAAHLAASFVWGNGTAGVGGHEGSLGDCSSPFYVRPLTGPLASFEPFNTTTCIGFPVVYGTDDYAAWTADGFGVGFATGSSRHFSLSNQSAGPKGAIDLPIPTVAAPNNTIVITKATVPSNATGVTFPFTSSQLGAFSLTSPFPSSKAFTGIAGGVEYDVAENNVSGWTLNNVSCAVTAGTDDGTGTWPTSGTNPTAAITLGAADTNVTLTCTYTNIKLNPATTLTLKSQTPSGSSVEAGTLVTIVVTETNSGNDPLSNVSVTGGGVCASFSPASVASLAVGAAQDFTCTFTAAAGANAWTADGVGTDSLGNPVPTTNEHQSGSVNGVAPSTSLTLKSAPTSVEAGSTVTIVVTETNTGNGPLTNVNVTGGGSCASFTPASVTLAAGASQDYTCTFTAVAGANAWSALGHGTDSLGNAAPADGESQSGSVNGVTSSTSLTFVSQVPAGTVEAGTSVTITVNEKNTGNGTITGVSVTGSPCATFAPPGGFSGSLAAGESATFTCTFTALVGTNTWSALGHGTDSLGNPVPTTGESATGNFQGVLSTLIVVKHTVGGNGSFNFAGTGSGVPANFPLTTSGGTATTIFAAIPSGPKSITETVPANWLGNTTNVSCAEIVTGVTPSVIGTLTAGEVAAGGTVAANVSLGIGATVRCDFYNGLLPTLTIVKTVQGTGTATFTFPVTGDNTLNPTITPPPAPSTATYPPGPPTPPPGVLLNLGSNGTTSNNTISESAPPAGYTLTDFTCTGYTGGGTGAGALDSNGVPTSWNFNANFGNNVVCRFVNNNAEASRTQGFWATHTQLSNDVWDGTNPTIGTVLPAGASPVMGSGDEVFGPGAGCPVAFTINAIPVKAENNLMGGFWASISQTSTKTNRTAIDHARMQMMQQYLAAVLNVHMFGSIGEGVLANARAVYCGTNRSAIQAEIGLLGNLNQSGDTLGTTPGGSATAKKSKAQADIDAWDTPTNPVD